MALKGLINKQSIIIDDHKRGIREIKKWDNPEVDVHIDKITNFPLEGVRQSVRIKVPINSNRPIKIENRKRQELNEIPSRLKKEIQRALEDKEKRERFIADIIEVLLDFETVLSDEERVRQVISNLSKHFELRWTKNQIATYANDSLRTYTQFLIDDLGNEFYISIDKQKIKIAENTGYEKLEKK